MSDKPLRCAVIGAGRMGKHHARLYARTPGCELVAVVDPRADRAGPIVEEWGGRACTTVEELPEGVDCATVSTPTATHLSVVEALLARRAHCLVEKPLAPTVDEAQRIAEAAARSGCVLQVGHVVRYDPVMMAIRELKIVQPRFVEVDRISPMTFRSVDVGVVLDMMIHDLDVLLMLMGSEPEEIHANAVSVLGEAEDVCNARLIFPAAHGQVRAVANVTASRLALKTERKMRVIGEDIYVSADFAERRGTVVRKGANQARLTEIRQALREGQDLSGLDYRELVQIEELVVGAGEPLRLQLDDFLDAVRSGRRPTVDAQAGFAAVRTAERIVAAARSAGARMV